MKQILTIRILVLSLLIAVGIGGSVFIVRSIWIAHADGGLHRDHQKEIAIWFAPDRTEVCLHPKERSGNAQATFELLDNTNKVIAQATKSAQLGNDSHITTSLPFSLGKVDDATRSTFKWNRLRYTLTVDNETRTEIVQIADAMPNEFALRVTGPERVEPGMIYRVAAHAENPESGESIKGISVNASVKDGKADKVLAESTLVTNEQGQAFFEFKVKKDWPRNAGLVLKAFKDGDFETQRTTS
ncbi:MAG TPA: hypothetical protein VFC63_10010 [Blastocatellia bacterium]|nr:hypothetical protein [Blastocatellia bacterium]